jgi:hypothetical protein
MLRVVVSSASKRIHFKDVLKQLKRHVNEEREWVIVLYRQNEKFSAKSSQTQVICQ